MDNVFNQFQCPLCGRSVSVRKFDPSDFANDVIGIRFEGLGYGRGFGVAEKGTLLDTGDPVLGLIANRTLEISQFLMDAGIVTDNMLTSHLPVLESNTEAQAKLESEIQTLEVDNEELENKNAWFTKEVIKLESEVDVLEVGVEELKNKNAGLKNEVDELGEQLEESRTQAEGEMDEIYDYIADTTSMVSEVIGPEFYDYYDESENALENLNNMTAFLVNEYTVLVEEAEETG